MRSQWSREVAIKRAEKAGARVKVKGNKEVKHLNLHQREAKAEENQKVKRVKTQL
jgi:hypothetical protein